MYEQDGSYGLGREVQTPAETDTPYDYFDLFVGGRRIVVGLAVLHTASGAQPR
jgi:hypothetical protein